MNKVILIGRLVRDPELRFTTGTGIAISTFSLAVDRKHVDQNGKKQTDFINIVCWRNLAEIVANNLSKGRLVAVSGSIQTRKYQANDGSNRWVTEVIAEEVKFLDYANDRAPATSTGNNYSSSPGTDNSGFMPVYDDDDIPF